MAKTEVYSWRVSPEVKGALEEAARGERQSLGALLDQIAQEWLQTRRRSTGRDEVAQRHMHAAAIRCFGTIRGGDPRRSERVRELVRARLERRRGR